MTNTAPPRTRTPPPNSVEAFALEEGISRAAVYAEIRSGRLPARKLGIRTLIFPEDRAIWRASLPPFPRA